MESYLDDYERAYFIMFLGCVRALEALELGEYELVKKILINTNQLAEARYINGCIDECRARRAAGELKEEEAIVARLMKERPPMDWEAERASIADFLEETEGLKPLEPLDESS